MGKLLSMFLLTLFSNGLVQGNKAVGWLRSPRGPTFHNGSILVGNNSTISVYVVFYGDFTRSQRSTIRSFLRSFQSHNNEPSTPPPPFRKEPPVKKEPPPPPPSPPSKKEPPPPFQLPPPPPKKEPPPRPSPPPFKSPKSPPPPSPPKSSLFYSSEESSKLRPTVRKWWQITQSYLNRQGVPVARCIRRGQEIRDKNYSMGRSLNLSHVEELILRSFGYFPVDPQGIYLVLTSEHVKVKGLCRQCCGQHSFITTGNKALSYAWIGNAPGNCSWPFGSRRPNKKQMHSKRTLLIKGLVPPNGDIAVDGMIVNIAEMLSAVATNPHLRGYYHENDKKVKREVASFCKDTTLVLDKLLKNKTSEATFNVYGHHNKQFLVPAIWNPSRRMCAIQA